MTGIDAIARQWSDMSPDEVLPFLTGAVLALIACFFWYRPLVTVRRLGGRTAGVRLAAVAPVASLGVLFAVLKTAASWDVRDSPIYLTVYMAIGAGWIGSAALAFRYLGLSVRDDVAERGNGAAAIALAGAVLAMALCFAGGNVGDGPGWWVVIACAGLSTIGLVAAWLSLDMLSGIVENVTVERDPAAGVRLCGFLIACGLVLGRAVAGDWMSLDATFRDFVRIGAPVLLFVGAAALHERFARPTVERPKPSLALHGVAAALCHVAAAALYVMALGVPT